MKTIPYIGITGFTTTEELSMVQQVAELAGINTSRYQIMAGIITSPGTISGGRGAIRAGIEELTEVTKAMPSSFIGAIHHQTHDQNKLGDELSYLLESANGTSLVQINNTWPSPKTMRGLKDKFSGLGFVLQFPPEALKEGTKEIAKRAGEYAGLARYTLVDPSQGAGMAFDPVHAAEIMNAVSETLPDAIMGVAGGLEGANVGEQVLAVAGHYQRTFVIDAEGRLRTNDHTMLVEEKIRTYLREAVSTMKELKQG